MGLIRLNVSLITRFSAFLFLLVNNLMLLSKLLTVRSFDTFHQISSARLDTMHSFIYHIFSSRFRICTSRSPFLLAEYWWHTFSLCPFSNGNTWNDHRFTKCHLWTSVTFPVHFSLYWRTHLSKSWSFITNLMVSVTRRIASQTISLSLVPESRSRLIPVNIILFFLLFFGSCSYLLDLPLQSI